MASAKPIIDANAVAILINDLATMQNQSLNAINEGEKLISQLKNQLITKANATNIKQVERKYFWTRWLWWLTKVKDWKETIQNWKEFVGAQEQLITSSQTKLIPNYRNLLTGFNQIQLMQLVTKSQLDAKIDYFQIGQFLQHYDRNYLDLVSCICFLKVNQVPFCVIEYRALLTINHPYYGQATFSYYDKETKTYQYETLSATYSHWIPKITHQQLFLSQFKIDQSDQGDFSIISGAKTKAKSKIIFHNPDFANYYLVRCDSNRQQSWLTWFDPLSQNNLIQFANEYPDVQFQFAKIGNYFVLKPKWQNEILKIDQISNLNASLTNYLSAYEKTTFISQRVFDLISNLKRLMILPQQQATKQPTKRDFRALFYCQFQHWSSLNLIGLDYFEVVAKEVVEQATYYQIKHCNYKIIKQTKMVAITGKYVGTKMVPVHYDDYQPYFIKKMIVHLCKQLDPSVEIVCNHYGQSLTIKNRKWYEQQADVINFIKQFQTLCKEQKLDLCLTWNDRGLMIGGKASDLKNPLVVNWWRAI